MSRPVTSAAEQARTSVTEARIQLAVGIVAVIAAVLGFIGFQRFLPAPGIEAGQRWTDVLYYTLQLFLLDSSPLQTATDLPVELEIARFLAPSTAALALLLAAKTVYDSTYDAMRARRLRDHTVVCGSGTPALLIARSVAAEGRACVVVDPSTHGARVLRRTDVADGRSGVLGVSGDARDVLVLREARVDRAREVLVVTGDSTHNADVASALDTVLAGVPEPPRCFLETTSPALAAALAARGLNSGSPVPLEAFVPAARAARRMLDRYLVPFDGPRTVLVVGAGAQFDAVVDELDRRTGGGSATRPWRAVGPDYVDDLDPRADPEAAFVCLDDDLRAVETGLGVLRRLRERRVDVVVAVARSTSLGSVITGDDLAVPCTGLARLHVVNTTDCVYSVVALREGFHLDMARAAHEDYVRRARERGEGVGDNPSTVPWEDLPGHLRRSNLEQARTVSAKLRAIGCAVVPLVDPRDPFVLQPDEIERLARDEHDRWTEERRLGGWRPGPRDDEVRTHPDLVPWVRLTETARQKDRDAVAAIPRQLRRAGLQIVRAVGSPSVERSLLVTREDDGKRSRTAD